MWKDDAPSFGAVYSNDGAEIKLIQYWRGIPPGAVWDAKTKTWPIRYHTITIRRSTGRFTYSETDRYHFDYIAEVLIPEEKTWTYGGRCFSVAGRRLVVDLEMNEESK